MHPHRMNQPMVRHGSQSTGFAGLLTSFWIGKHPAFRYKRLVPCLRFQLDVEKAMRRLRMTAARRLPPVWLMGLTNCVFGLMGGFAVVTVPQMLAAQGMSGGHIAAITAV